MTKLVQPNVLRTYQSGEQYAANEVCLYNGVPAYTNTALAQGVAGTAGNFTNISNGPIKKRITVDGFTVTLVNGGTVEVFVDDIAMSVVLPSNTILSGTRLVANVQVANSTFSFSYSWSGQSGGFSKTLVIQGPDGTYLGSAAIAGASGTATIASQACQRGDILDYQIQESGTLVRMTLFVNSNSRLYSDNMRIYRNLDASQYFHYFSTPALTSNRLITLPNADVNLGKVAQAVTSSVDGYFAAADYSTLTKKVYITSTTGYVISGNDVNRDHEFILSSNATVHLHNLQPTKKAVFRSGDGGTYTVTSSGAAAVYYDTSGPINVSPRRQITISGNLGTSHIGEVTNANVDTSHFKLVGTTGSASFNIPSGTSVITVPSYNVNLGNIPFLNNSAASPITMGGINYILIPPGSSGPSVPIPITYLTTTVNTKFIVYNNTPSATQLLANVTWAGQLAGFSGLITIAYSDQSNLSPPLEYLTGNPGVMSGASGSTLVRIGNIPANGSVEVMVRANQPSSISLGVNVSSANGGLGTNNQNLKIYKSLSDFAKYMYVDAAALTTARGLTLPDANVNLGDLPSVATTDTNTLSAGHVRCRILGGVSNVVGGTDNVTIGATQTLFNTVSSKNTVVGCTFPAGNSAITLNAITGSFNTLIGVRGNFPLLSSQFDVSGTGSTVVGGLFKNIQKVQSSAIILGTSTESSTYYTGAAARLSLNALHANTDTVPVSGTVYATIDGAQTLTIDNCILAYNSTGCAAHHTIEFVINVGSYGLGATNSAACIMGTRKLKVFKATGTGTLYIGALETVGTDETFGSIGGTITFSVVVNPTTGILELGAVRTGGIAGQEGLSMSVRTSSHYTR